jgi:hypothetical protein
MRKLTLPLLATYLTYTAASAAIIVDFTLSAPGVQQSPLQAEAGSLTETFNSFSAGLLPASGSLAIGSYTAESGFRIFNANAWGGAGGTGRYASTDNSKTLSVSITPSKYVGFWWSAGNAGNLVNIYGAGDSLLASFNSTAIPTLIGPKASPNSVVAADAQTYSGALYYGNPNGTFGQPDSLNEPYAYVNLRLSDPTLTFTRIDFTGPGFEFDNVTISPNYYDPTASVPEPGQVAASLLLLAGIGGYVWLKRRKTGKPAVAAV